MENETTISETSITDVDFFQQYIRIINLILSFTGVGFNFLLIIILFLIGRSQCTTYFLLILMTICDFLYCTVYLSILLTVDQYLNIINHQILCPLSFFLTPFTFTGSALLLFICLLHFITNYVRKYDTVLGQIGGRLSVVFVLAFIIIRSVLSSTSIELITLDPNKPYTKYCTIDMNTSPIVMTVQHFNHIFAEVTDILVYIGWVVILIVYFISLLPCVKICSLDKSEPNLSSIDKPFSFASLLSVQNNTNNNNNNNNNTIGQTTLTMDPSEMSNMTGETTIITNKARHHDVSLIIIPIGLLSILFYLPIMILKYSTMFFVYRDRTFLSTQQTNFLQTIQHTAHLFCLSIRILPYLLFDKRIHLFFSQMIGMKCMKIERRRTLSRKRRYRFKHKYIFHCQCHRRQQILDFHHEDGQQESRLN